MSWDIVVKTFYSDSGLAVGLANANERLKQLSKTGPAAGAGVKAIEQGVRSLAFSAVGIPGPLGRVAGGLLQLGGGNALMLAAVAGIGAVGFAIRALTKDARDNAAAQKEMTDELGKIGTHGAATQSRIRIAELEQERDDPTLAQRFKRAPTFSGPRIGGGWRTEELEQINREIAEERIKLAAALRGGTPAENTDQARLGASVADQRAALRRSVVGGQQFAGGPRTTDEDETEQLRVLELTLDKVSESIARKVAHQEREARVSDATTALQETATRSAQAAAIRNDMVGQSEAAVTERLRVHALTLRGIPPAVAEVIAATERQAQADNLVADARTAATAAAGEATIRNRMLGASEEAVAEALRIHRLQLQGVPAETAVAIAANERMTASAMKSADVLRNQLPAAFAAMGRAATESMSAVAASAINSVVQIAQSLPGVSPVMGGILGFVGGIISGLFSQSRPMPVAVTNPEDLRPEGPDRFTLQIISASTGEMVDELIYEIGRRTRLDRIIRIPRTVTVRR